MWIEKFPKEPRLLDGFTWKIEGTEGRVWSGHYLAELLPCESILSLPPAERLFGPHLLAQFLRMWLGMAQFLGISRSSSATSCVILM